MATSMTFDRKALVTITLTNGRGQKGCNHTAHTNITHKSCPGNIKQGMSVLQNHQDQWQIRESLSGFWQ